MEKTDDCIIIENLTAFANHGVMPEEKTMGQKFVITLRLYADMSAAARHDDINRAVDYAEVCAFVTEFTRRNRRKLIEAAAASIAEALLIRYPLLNRVGITMKKPWAPIGLPLDQVAVSLERSRHRVYIGIGSNMGDRKGYLDLAVKRISEDEKSRVLRVSKYIETKPVGIVEQADFLNGCIELDTVRSPHGLLDFLHEIENEAGRAREIHWGPRTLDLDILLYDDIVMSDDTLIIPHPELDKRYFALKPLSELAPYKIHPLRGVYISDLLTEVKQS